MGRKYSRASSEVKVSRTTRVTDVEGPWGVQVLRAPGVVEGVVVGAGVRGYERAVSPLARLEVQKGGGVLGVEAVGEDPVLHRVGVDHVPHRGIDHGGVGPPEAAPPGVVGLEEGAVLQAVEGRVLLGQVSQGPEEVAGVGLRGGEEAVGVRPLEGLEIGDRPAGVALPVVGRGPGAGEVPDVPVHEPRGLALDGVVAVHRRALGRNGGPVVAGQRRLDGLDLGGRRGAPDEDDVDPQGLGGEAVGQLAHPEALVAHGRGRRDRDRAGEGDLVPKDSPGLDPPPPGGGIGDRELGAGDGALVAGLLVVGAGHVGPTDDLAAGGDAPQVEVVRGLRPGDRGVERRGAGRHVHLVLEAGAGQTGVRRRGDGDGRVLGQAGELTFEGDRAPPGRLAQGGPQGNGGRVGGRRHPEVRRSLLELKAAVVVGPGGWRRADHEDGDEGDGDEQSPTHQTSPRSRITDRTPL